ncbi:hypothetical protein ES319_D07G150200v1 [Gossypium barbadense]|uniref:Rad60/SUMO-like domain-containing protein n=1 Tax=Gossypium barbadense TaxID=3634 RepID=A0A5J5QSR2_GOSBA|nr:hypothetical protein ES319_D07G150200v1 [Gossypium barbadense]
MIDTLTPGKFGLSETETLIYLSFAFGCYGFQIFCSQSWENMIILVFLVFQNSKTLPLPTLSLAFTFSSFFCTLTPESFTKMAQNDGGSSGGSNPVDNLASRPKRKRITIHIQSQDENRLAFKIMPNLKLSKMFHEYCQRKQYDLRTVRFFHEGRRLLGKYTAAKVPFFVSFPCSPICYKDFFCH